MADQEPDELVRRAQLGETAAFAELFRKHRATVAKIAFRMLGRSADLDDVVQDVFLQVHRSLPDFRGQAKFSTWLHRVAVNVVLMTRRRAKSRPQYAHEEHARHEPDQHALPDHDVIRTRRLDAFRRLLDKLSEKKRTVFVLHELEGMAPTRIAEIVDCPVLTVRTRLFYARKELAQMMRSEPCLAQLVDQVASGLRDDSGSSGPEASGSASGGGASGGRAAEKHSMKATSGRSSSGGPESGSEGRADPQGTAQISRREVQ